jgi:hypothetical protein
MKLSRLKIKIYLLTFSILLISNCGYRIPGSISITNTLDVLVHNKSQETVKVFGAIEQSESSQLCDFPGRSTKTSDVSSQSQYHLKINLNCSTQLGRDDYFFNVKMKSNYEVSQIIINDPQVFSKFVTGLQFQVFDSEYKNPTTVKIVDSLLTGNGYQYLWHQSPQKEVNVAWIETEKNGNEEIYKLWIALPIDNQFRYAGFPEALGIITSASFLNGYYINTLIKQSGLYIAPTLISNPKNYQLICDDVGCNLSVIGSL